MGGKKPEEYKGVAKFFAFLSDTNRQAKLHQESGYLPITKAAYEKTKADGFYKKNPDLRDAAEGAHQQGADGEFARPAVRQHGADARRLGRGNRGGAAGQEDPPSKRSTRRSPAAMPCCARSKRPRNNPYVANQASASSLRRKTGARPRSAATSASRDALNGKVRRLQQQAAALSAADPAAHHHIGILLLAGQPGGLAVISARGRLRPRSEFVGLENYQRAVRAARILQRDADDGGFFIARRGAVAVASHCCSPRRPTRTSRLRRYTRPS